jgi:hypothetical protein
MHMIKRPLSIFGGALLLAAIMFGILAAPGFLSDRDSMVPNNPTAVQEAGR